MCKECEKKQKKLDKIVGFCCRLENESYDRGEEDTIKPITDKIFKIIDKK